MKNNFNLPFVLMAGVFTMFSVTGCGTVSPVSYDSYSDVTTHVGLRGDLKQDDFSGVVAVTDLMKHGDHGIGLIADTDEIFLLLSGVIYRSDAEGLVISTPDKEQASYATTKWFKPDRMYDVADMNESLFERALAMRRRTDGAVEAIDVTGFFRSVKLRTWSNGEKGTKKLSDIGGTMVGYFYPADLSGIRAPGYQLFFIDTEKKNMGEVLNHKIGRARIRIDQSSNLQVILRTKKVVPAMSLPVNPAAVSR